MAKPSLKNVSTADIESAFARVLQELTGWELCEVRISALKIESVGLGAGEACRIKLQADFSQSPSLDLPF